MKFRIFVPVWLLLASAFQMPAHASESPAVDPRLAESGWMELAVPGKKPTRYVRVEDGALEARSSESVSILYRMMSAKEQDCRVLTWRWRVDEAVPATDPAAVGQDDRDLALHVWFPKTGEPGLWQALSSAVASVMGVPPLGRSLTYVFGGTGERNRRLVNPHYDPDGHMIVLRPSGAPIGKWFDERIDFAADYERAFGEPAPKPMYVAISADSDDTGSQGRARVSNLAFHPR